jgi:hypothetical protein
MHTHTTHVCMMDVDHLFTPPLILLLHVYIYRLIATQPTLQANPAHLAPFTQPTTPTIYLHSSFLSFISSPHLRRLRLDFCCRFSDRLLHPHRHLRTLSLATHSTLPHPHPHPSNQSHTRLTPDSSAAHHCCHLVDSPPWLVFAQAGDRRDGVHPNARMG